MLRSVPHLEWQVLRAILRHKGPAPGAALRLVPSRRTKNGVHLTALAAAGLIEAAGEPAPPARAAADAPAEDAAVRTRWRLTEKGRHAAEFGEYDDGSGGLTLPTPEEFAAAKQAEAAKGRKPKG